MDWGALLSGIAHRRPPLPIPQLQAPTDKDKRAYGGVLTWPRSMNPRVFTKGFNGLEIAFVEPKMKQQ